MPPQDQNQTPASEPQAPATQAPTPVQPATSTAPASPAKKGMPMWVKVLGILVLAFIAFIIFVFATATLATKAPQKVSDAFVNDVQSGNSTDAYGLTSADFQKSTTQAQLDEIIQRIKPALQGEETITSRSINKTASGSLAVILYDVKTQTGTKYIKVALQKNGNDWQVVSYDSSDSPISE